MESFVVRYRNLIVLLVLLLVQIIGLAVQVRRTDAGRRSLDNADSSGVRLIRLWANAVVSPAEQVVENSKTGVFGFWKGYIDLRQVRQQNQDLQDTVDRLRLEQAALLEDARQGQRLQAMLQFQQKYLYKTLPAQIIGSSGSELSRVFYINKGKSEGLARDMAVINGDGIVGKVREVFPHTAQVLAINDQTSGAGVILESTRIRGILRGNEQGQPQIVGILADQRIKPGENVLTGGGDQIFPRGLPAGVVEKVDPDPDRDGFIIVSVKPAAHLDRLDEVLVITSTEPRFSPQQEKDIATSEELKSSDAAALSEQRKASAIMAERLPGLTDPNAPAKPAIAPQGANGAPATPAITPVPKIIPPLHPDRFTPGHAGQPEPGGPGATAPRPAAPKPPLTKPEAASGSATSGKPKTPAKPDPQPQPQRNQ
ncbi:MAG TPA: rod shape-determining protein MreC [Terracidiphilus sp.]